MYMMKLILCGTTCLVLSKRYLRKFLENIKVLGYLFEERWWWNKEVQKVIEAKNVSHKDLLKVPKLDFFLWEISVREKKELKKRLAFLQISADMNDILADILFLRVCLLWYGEKRPNKMYCFELISANILDIGWYVCGHC